MEQTATAKVQRAEEVEQDKGFRKYLRAKYFVPVAAVLLVIGILVWLHYRVRESTDDAQIDGHIVSISPRVGGTILAVHVQDNQYVQAGTVLIELDARDYKVAVERAQADLQQAQADALAANNEMLIGNTATSSSLNSADA